MPIRKNDYVVCKLRHMYNMGCHNCMYNGSICDSFKKSHKGLNPAEYHNKLARENKIVEREEI